MWTGGQKPDYFVDVINGWSLAKQAESALINEHRLLPHLTGPAGIPQCPLNLPLDIRYQMLPASELQAPATHG